MAEPSTWCWHRLYSRAPDGRGVSTDPMAEPLTGVCWHWPHGRAPDGCGVGTDPMAELLTGVVLALTLRQSPWRVWCWHWPYIRAPGGCGVGTDPMAELLTGVVLVLMVWRNFLEKEETALFMELNPPEMSSLRRPVMGPLMRGGGRY